MIYLFIQTWIWIFLAGLLGLLVGWWIWGRQCAALREQLDGCRGRLEQLESSADTASPGASLERDSEIEQTDIVDTAEGLASRSQDAEREVEVEVRDEWRPLSLDAPDGDPDDLKRIKGVGPVIQTTLNGLGIYHFHQVAAFTDDNVKWVDNYISFPGRIQREGWVAQAADLAEGRSTEFADRYDRGGTGPKNGIE